MDVFKAVIEAFKLAKDGYKFARALQAEGEAAKGREIVAAMHRKYESSALDPGLPKEPTP